MPITHEDEDQEDEPQIEVEEDPEIETPENTVLSGICLNSVIGTSNPKTLKLKGELAGAEVVVLIQCCIQWCKLEFNIPFNGAFNHV